MRWIVLICLGILSISNDARGQYGVPQPYGVPTPYQPASPYAPAPGASYTPDYSAYPSATAPAGYGQAYPAAPAPPGYGQPNPYATAPLGYGQANPYAAAPSPYGQAPGYGQPPAGYAPGYGYSTAPAGYPQNYGQAYGNRTMPSLTPTSTELMQRYGEGVAYEGGSVILFDPLGTQGTVPALPTPPDAPSLPASPPPQVEAAPADLVPIPPPSVEGLEPLPAGDGAAPDAAPETVPPEEIIVDMSTGRSKDYVDGIYIINTDYLTSYFENAWRIVSGPLRYDEDDWTNLAIVAGLTGALIIADEALFDFWQEDVRSGFTNDVAEGITELGESKNIVIGALGAYALSEALGLEREKAASLLTLESFVLTALMIEGIKYITGRERPNDTDDKYDFNGPSGSNTSFPSGHSGHTFAVATTIAEIYGEDNPWVPWVAYPAATLTALARVNDEKHWVSDVVAGAAVGYFISKMVTTYNPFLVEHGFALQPFVQEATPGVALTYHF